VEGSWIFEEGGSASAVSFGLFRNVFNPAKGEVLYIEMNVLEAGAGEIQIVNSHGQEIQSIRFDATPFMSPVEWDGRNKSHSMVASGTYMLILKSSGGKQFKKVVIVK
jgi:flagellar hook assembly protein FlgD